MNKPEFVYVTYIRSTPKKVWSAITQPKFARQYWGGMANVSDWKKNSDWRHVTEEKEVYVEGKVLESDPPKRLVLTWADPDAPADVSRLTMEIEPVNKMVRLTVTHNDFKKGSTMAAKVSWGWPLVLSSLKSFLETGKAFDIWCTPKPDDLKPAA
jgi:uncharacterized protein YndB with AHSA1/START domain